MPVGTLEAIGTIGSLILNGIGLFNDSEQSNRLNTITEDLERQRLGIEKENVKIRKHELALKARAMKEDKELQEQERRDKMSREFVDNLIGSMQRDVGFGVSMTNLFNRMGTTSYSQKNSGISLGA